MNFKQAYETLVAGMGTLIVYLVGGWDTTLKILAVFMVLDLITGVFASAITKSNLDSRTMFKGLAKKMFILILVIMGTLLDRLIGTEAWIFRTVVALFYIANEGLSIIENCGKIGLPVPKKLVEKLEQLKESEVTK